MANPFKSVMNIRRDELPLSLLMFSYFFLVITSFWILKPIKKSLFIGFYQADGFNLGSWHLLASQAELIAKVCNMIVAILAVAIFSWLSRRLRRQQLTYAFSSFFLFCYVAYSFFINQPNDGLVWSFYLFGDLFSTLMVATFFVFLNDSVTPDRAKRIYGLVGLGGVTGGAFGSSIVRAWISNTSTSNWLWVCFGICLLILLIAMAAGRLVTRLGWVSSEPPISAQGDSKSSHGKKTVVSKKDEEKQVNPAIAGAKLVFRSRYLLSIVAIVGLYEIVSTILDFQFTATIEHYVAGEKIGEYFSGIFALTNWVSMFVQLFLTSYIMTRFGLMAALSFLPMAILLGATGFLIAPVLMIGSLLNTADNGFSYSINQSAKEALYVPTTRDEKYKAKAFIDMFVQRFAKVLAVVVSLVITTTFSDFATVRWLSIFVIALIIGWAFAVRYAGRKFNEVTSTSQTHANVSSE